MSKRPLDEDEDDFEFVEDGEVEVPRASDLLRSDEPKRYATFPHPSAVPLSVEQQQYAVIRSKLPHIEAQSPVDSGRVVDEPEDVDDEPEIKTTPTAFELRRKLMNRRRRAIYKKLNREQKERYEKYLSGKFPKGSIKKVMMNVLGTTKVADQLAVIMAGIAKVFAGDVVEQSLLVMSEWGQTGAIRPVHMREAYRRLKAQGIVPSAQPKRLFRL